LIRYLCFSYYMPLKRWLLRLEGIPSLVVFRPGWTSPWATWSTACYSGWRFGSRWSLRSLPTQAILWFYDMKAWISAEGIPASWSVSEVLWRSQVDSKVCICKQTQREGILEACQTEKDRGHVRHNPYQGKIKDRQAFCSDAHTGTSHASSRRNSTGATQHAKLSFC